jgi:hypothetical protein
VECIELAMDLGVTPGAKEGGRFPSESLWSAIEESLSVFHSKVPSVRRHIGTLE